MIKKIALVSCLFLIVHSVTAQTIELTGIVTDSLQKPLPYANIIAKPNDVTKDLKFAITDNEGLYRLELMKGNQYTISISYIGFESLNIQFTATKTVTKNFILKESTNKLDEVVIELPVTVKQDTIIYNTNHFVNGSERKLKDVLKKLPGVKVDKKGGVTVQGKKITKMLVDGKKFFYGGTKLAVENIPANVLDRVEVLDNYNEVAFLKNISDSNEMAMNIKLKKDKKNFLFGDIEAGKGNQNYYRTHSNLFYYAPNINVNFIGNINNAGEKTFTFKDYMNFQGGINAVFSGNFKWGRGDFAQFLNSYDIFKRNSKFAALNITKAINKLDVSGFVVLSKTVAKSFEESLNQYANVTELKNNTNNVDNLFGIGKLNLEFAPSSKTKWYARTQIKRNNNQANNEILSTINSNQNSFLTKRKVEAVSVNQNIEWHQQQSNKHTFSFIVDYILDKNTPVNYWQTSNQILHGLIPVDNSQNSYRLHQNREIEEHNFNSIFKHYWIINSNNHVYLTLGNSLSKDSFLTDDKQELDNGSIKDFSSNGFGNYVNFTINDFYLGIQYKLRRGVFTLKQGVELHNYRWKVSQQTYFSNNKWVVLPDFLAKIEFNKFKSINIRYNLKTRFSDASKLANQFYLQSYNSIFKGNDNLENELYHNATLYYHRFSLYRGLMMHANINYIKKIEGYTNFVKFDDTNPDPTQRTNQFLTTKLMSNPNEDLMFSTFVHKTIRKIKYKMEGNANYSKYLQSINEQFQANKSKSYSLEAGLETLFDNFPTIEIGYKHIIGNYSFSNSTTKFVQSEPFVNIDYEFLKGVIFNFDYKRMSYQNKSQNQKNIYEIANTTLSYKKENVAWSYKLTVTNLFNTTFKQSNSFSDYLIKDTKTYILPRVVMFSVAYNL